MSQDGDTSSLREADRVYADLRTRVLTLDLTPGSVLDEARIVQDQGVSRTPVREAVIRLVSEGLLKRDGRQVIVPMLQLSDLRAFFEALQLLSRATHRMAAERRDDAHLLAIVRAAKAFEAEAKRGEALKMNDANSEFHLAISRAADSSFLHEAYESVQIQSLRLARQCFVNGSDPEYSQREHIEQIIRDHSALVAAIRDADGDTADRIAREHSDLFRNRVSRQLLGPSAISRNIQLGVASTGMGPARGRASAGSAPGRPASRETGRAG